MANPAKEVIFFFDPSAENGFLSQTYHSPFTSKGITYTCAEQFMMAAKAKLFDDEKIYQEIMKTQDIDKYKDLGRKISNFLFKEWYKYRCDFVLEANMLKFSQNEDLKELLLGTGQSTLAQADPTDRVWGIGLWQNDKRAKDPTQWLGTNLLGTTLETVRKNLQNQVNSDGKQSLAPENEKDVAGEDDSMEVHYSDSEMPTNKGEKVIFNDDDISGEVHYSDSDELVASDEEDYVSDDDGLS